MRIVKLCNFELLHPRELEFFSAIEDRIFHLVGEAVWDTRQSLVTALVGETLQEGQVGVKGHNVVCVGVHKWHL